MTTSTLRTRWGADTIEVSADWSQANCPISGDLPGGYQVADFRHNARKALRRAVEAMASAEGLDTADDDVSDAIDIAVDTAKKTVQTAP